ncbi:hypothetical protein AB6N24_19930 [Cellulomonas sp. 179-A 4D5 NHS]|uniref:hypothetical protein n=1 Tax=Cellulomonas sp. 179-A 4D5 NHS TaxID=3142378 RepID=UPI0039A0C4E3
MTAYDETLLYQRVSALPPLGQAAFAAACSQRLGSMCAVLGEAWGLPVPDVFGTTQAAVWAICAGERGTSDADDLDAAVSADVPHDDDEDWDRFSGYLQSAGIALIHAILAARSPDPRRDVFGARQLDEVADFTASDLRDAGDDAAADAVLQAVHEGLDEELASLEAGSGSAATIEHVRRHAELEGRRLGALLTASLPAED